MKVYLQMLGEEVSDAIPPHLYKVLCPSCALVLGSLSFPYIHALVDWYCGRARDMDLQSYQLLNALSYAILGFLC